MNYKLNPCKACLEFYKENENSCDINTINDCLSQTVAAFKNVSSNNNFTGTSAEFHIKDCLNNLKQQEGRNNCNFQLQTAPVFVQSPHYFPQLLKETGNPDISFLKCLEMSKNNNPYPKESMQNCIIDFMSVEKENMVNNTEKYSIKKTSRNSLLIFLFVILTFLIIGFYLYKNQQLLQM